MLLRLIRFPWLLDAVLLLPLLWISLKVRLQYFFYLLSTPQGLPDSADSRWYLSYARRLLDDFQIGAQMNDLFYLSYNLLLACLLKLLGSPAKIVFLQSVTAGLSVVLVYLIARRLFNRTTAVIAAFVYAYMWEITLWSTYILTESFFISLLLLCVYLLLLAVESPKLLFRWLFAAAALVLFFFRPTGMLAVLFMLFYIGVRIGRAKITAFIRPYPYTWIGIAMAVLFLFLLALGNGLLDPLLASMRYNVKLVLYNVYAKGWIYDHPSAHDLAYRPDYRIDIGNSLILSFLIHNWDHIMVLYAKRAVAFLGPWVWKLDLTTGAGIQKAVRLLLPSLLFALASIAALWNGTLRRASILWLMPGLVFLWCLLFFIDGMYRYRAPGMPFMAIVAAYGADRVVRWVLLLVRTLVELARHKLARRDFSSNG
ncbi:glycosyltransferase family 39 protein [Paenibacillus koleovorans]|uniref:glycosyltransferase family 39 protein n=1 Tax=Paenibacillus koleovorans TaxID=121608 RepID=UPI0013E2F024|nr:glycosyltransferase family 39 protein [Paenibacillus koleovorans]